MFRLSSCAIALIVVLASAIVPACGGLCCPKAAEPSVHATMPCCAGESSMTPREPSSAQPSTIARITAPIAVLARAATFAETPAPVIPTPRVASEASHEPAPPLFLLNAQFLI